MSTNNTEETIVALSTAPGMGAIAVIRMSGSDSFDIADCVFSSKINSDSPSHKAYYGNLLDEDRILDEVVLTLFRGPHSFTGEDTVEISCHGSVYIQQQILELLIRRGCRLAREGEFTMRAFMNGKMDLSQAEAVADLIATESAAAHQLAMNQMRGGVSKEINSLREKLIHFASMIELELDFSEEDVEFANRKDLDDLVVEIQGVCKNLIDSFATGNAIKNGVGVAIVGAPNMGKSTLLNRLLNEERALVTDIPGTTRDVIEERISIEGIMFRFIDTAGIRSTEDTIESMGIERSFDSAKKADIVVYLTDVIEVMAGAFRKGFEEFISQVPDKKVIVVLNKTDLDVGAQKSEVDIDGAIQISAKQGTGMEPLKAELVNLVKTGISAKQTVVSNVRHVEALTKAYEALSDVRTGLAGGITGDFLAIDIRKSLHHLGEITGEITTDDLLGNIFSKFCIGK